jgi:excisionase family DNA binding protein
VAETPRFFDIAGTVEYLRSIGLTGITTWTIRVAINSGRLAHIKEGKKFYVSKSALDAWLAKAEKKMRT